MQTKQEEIAASGLYSDMEPVTPDPAAGDGWFDQIYTDMFRPFELPAGVGRDVQREKQFRALARELGLTHAQQQRLVTFDASGGVR